MCMCIYVCISLIPGESYPSHELAVDDKPTVFLDLRPSHQCQDDSSAAQNMSAMSRTKGE